MYFVYVGDGRVRMGVTESVPILTTRNDGNSLACNESTMEYQVVSIRTTKSGGNSMACNESAMKYHEHTINIK